MRKSTLKKHRRLIQFVEYMISGGAYFWTGYLVFFACDKGLHWNLWWTKLAANVAGWTVNYLLLRYWAFRDPNLKSHNVKVSGRYIVITLVNFVIDYFIILGLKSVGITPYIGQFISAGFFTVWNYLWYRFWVFAAEPSRPLHHHMAVAPAVVRKNQTANRRARKNGR